MLREEFEQLTGVTLGPDYWDIVNTVYTWHPAIDDVTGKEQIAALYNLCGMPVIIDMLSTAEAYRDYEERRVRMVRELEDLDNDWDDYYYRRHECRHS